MVASMPIVRDPGNSCESKSFHSSQVCDWTARDTRVASDNRSPQDVFSRRQHASYATSRWRREHSRSRLCKFTVTRISSGLVVREACPNRFVAQRWEVLRRFADEVDDVSCWLYQAVVGIDLAAGVPAPFWITGARPTERNQPSKALILRKTFFASNSRALGDGIKVCFGSILDARWWRDQKSTAERYLRRDTFGVWRCPAERAWPVRR